MAEDRFSAVDYVVFSIMLLISALIGVWYGCGPGGKQKTTAEYLLADGKMKIVPVSISLLVTFLSAITLLGLPGEIFAYGTQFYVAVTAYFLICGIVGSVFVPFFRQQKIKSVNEYLERRFSVEVRWLGTGIYLLSTTLYLFVAIYAPALALEAVVGLPMYVTILATGVICTFYTSLGGLKAVIWTDVFQAGVMLAGLIIVAVFGTQEVGGATKVWEINQKYGRIKFFDFNPDPTVRNTFWTLTIGTTITLLPVWGIQQRFVQRYLAVRTLKDAKRVVWLNIPALILVITILAYDGMVIFATYAGCDLKVQGKITRGDQALPYFVVDKLGHWKGVPGLFTACLYAAALSTISSVQSALSLIILEDIVKKKMTLTDREAARISKIIVVVFGVIVIAGAFSVQYMGALVLQLALSISGISAGPRLVLFMFGMFIPRINAKGLYIGSFAGIAMSGWLFIGSTIYPPNRYPGLRSVEECPFYIDALAANGSFTNGTYNNRSAEILAKYGNGLIGNPFKPHGTPLADFYSLSYLWTASVSFLTTAIVTLVASFALETKAERQRVVDPKLLFPLKAWLLGFLPGHQFNWEIDEDGQDYDASDQEEAADKPRKNSSTEAGNEIESKL